MQVYQIEALSFYQNDSMNRPYHGVNHVLDLLRLFKMNDTQQLAPLIFTEEDTAWDHEGNGIDQLCRYPHYVEAAIYGHDMIYDTRHGDSEQLSAIEMVKILVQNGWDQRSADRVGEFILATKDHMIPANFPDSMVGDLQLFLSMDLAVGLATSFDMFTKRTEAIRCEYRQYDDAAWKAGRRAFYERMLAREVIFPHPLCEQAWGDQARRNMQDALNNMKDN